MKSSRKLSTSHQTYDIKKARKFLRKSDPVLASLIDKFPDFDPREWLTELPKLDPFGTLLFQIIGQQLSVQVTRKILERIMNIFGGRMPTPKQVLSIPPEELHRAGLSGRKVETFRLVAEQFAKRNLSKRKLELLSDQEIEEKLTHIKGIGPWSVHGFLIIALDRPDVVLPGDLALRKVIRRLYSLSRLPTEKKILNLSEKWRQYRSLATAYLFQAAYGRPEN